MQYFYIFIGGMIGAACSYLLSTFNSTTTFPYGTLSANLVGAFLMGLLFTLTVPFLSKHPKLKKALTTGCLGAFTTFSTFQFELITMLEQSLFLTALCYGIASYILGILSCYIGLKLGRELS